MDDYSAHLDPSAKEALKKRGYFLIILPGGITGDLQVNDTDLHYDLKSPYRQKESLLMIAKLRSNPSNIPSPSRDEIMQMCKSTWNKTVSKVDIHGAFKRNAISKLDGSEEYLVSSKLKALVWEEMKEFRSKLLNNPHPASLKILEEVVIPPDDVKYKLEKVVDGTPPDEGLKIIGGELIDEEWEDMENEQEENNLDKNGSGNMNVVDDVEEHENVDETAAAGDRADAAASSSVQESETALLIPESNQI